MNVVALSCIILLMLLFLKVPVFAAILGGSMVYFVLEPNVAALLIVQRMISGVESIPLMAVPFFITAGVFMNYTGVTQRIMDFCEVVTGKMYGGLGQVNILLSTLMGGLSGSSLADAAMQSKMLVPQMEKKGFSRSFSTVVTAFSSIITPLIPPGIAMILYGSIANLSIGKLFVAGVGPGIALCTLMMFMVSRMSKKRGYQPPKKENITASQVGYSLKNAFLPLCLPVIIIGGIRLGIFTPTEAGSVAVVYALFLGVLYREMKWRDFLAGIKESITTTASVLLIVSAASAFAWILTRERIPQMLTEMMITLIGNKYVFLLAVNIFLLIVGMFIEGNAALIVLVPLLAPMAEAYGINGIQFATVFNFNMAIGAVTPPMGTLMFTTCGITKCKIKDFIREAIPFYLLLTVCLLLITFVPGISLGLVHLIYPA